MDDAPRASPHPHFASLSGPSPDIRGGERPTFRSPSPDVGRGGGQRPGERASAQSHFVAPQIPSEAETFISLWEPWNANRLFDYMDGHLEPAPHELDPDRLPFGPYATKLPEIADMMTQAERLLFEQGQPQEALPLLESAEAALTAATLDRGLQVVDTLSYLSYLRALAHELAGEHEAAVQGYLEFQQNTGSLDGFDAIAVKKVQRRK